MGREWLILLQIYSRTVPGCQKLGFILRFFSELQKLWTLSEKFFPREGK
jgi:hypothetical protein